jgi:hypothetical protein
MICNAVIGAVYVAKTNNQSTRHQIPSKPKKLKAGKLPAFTRLS